MNMILGTLFKAIVVSVVWGAIATVSIAVFTEAYLVQSPGAEMHFIRGFNAVKLQIADVGLLGYVRTYVSPYIMAVGIIFVGCLIHAVWVKRGEMMTHNKSLEQPGHE